jgi:hypothetical protein
VFSRKNRKWTEDQAIEFDVGDDISNTFGNWGTVAIDGDTVVIGDDSENYSTGAVYIYVLQDGVWTMQAKLTGEAGYYDFGIEVSIRGDRLAIMTWRTSDDTGQVNIFKRIGSAWELEARPMLPTFNDPNLRVSSSSFSFDDATDRLVVLFNVYGLNQDVSAVYAVVFQNNEGAWTQQGQRFRPPQPADRVFDSKGYSLMSEGAVVLYTSWYDKPSYPSSYLHGKLSTFEYSQSQDQWMWTGDVISGLAYVKDMTMEGRRLVLDAYKEGESDLDSSVYIYTQALNKTWQLTETLPPYASYPVAVSGNRIAATLTDASVPSACVYSRPLRR